MGRRVRVLMPGDVGTDEIGLLILLLETQEQVNAIENGDVENQQHA